ncbi:hypothetical protein Fmac_020444 [Flemingia macrophylla]|uniref:Uncharacterized protein n=1 Tax=Flemingia macrophylla TaxID=520843 RepID=A0ABD1LU51_9FABA
MAPSASATTGMKYKCVEERKQKKKSKARPTSPVTKELAKHENDNEEGTCSNGCSTPKGKRFRIPETLTCPPAPKKKKVTLPCSSKRSLAFFASPDIELFLFSANNSSVSASGFTTPSGLHLDHVASPQPHRKGLSLHHLFRISNTSEASLASAKSSLRKTLKEILEEANKRLCCLNSSIQARGSEKPHFESGIACRRRKRWIYKKEEQNDSNNSKNTSDRQHSSRLRYEGAPPPRELLRRLRHARPLPLICLRRLPLRLLPCALPPPPLLAPSASVASLRVLRHARRLRCLPSRRLPSSSSSSAPSLLHR